jgi:hypothetical protein
MSELSIAFEWESPAAARGPELRATWARLEVEVDGESITKVVDHRARSLRTGVYLPLYPLAEWIVENWWALLHEVSSPKRLDDGYARRHRLSFAGEGFAYPPVDIQPEGPHVVVSWERSERADCRISYESAGTQRFDRDHVENELRTFVRGVITRLDDQGVGTTYLSEEWAAIEQSQADERQFCRAAGQIGVDPFSLSDEQARAIERAAQTLDASLRDEFFAAADLPSLSEQSRAVHSFIKSAAKSDIALKPLQRLRKRGLDIDARLAPWKQGYEAAAQVRNRLKFDGHRIDSLSSLGDALQLDPDEWMRASSKTHKGLDFLDAAVAVTDHKGALFAIKPIRSETGRTFAACRAVLEYLVDRDEVAALIAPTYSARQKRNRAFAAELLAPADAIRNKLSSKVISHEDVEAVADELSVSPFVVEHQINNHKLARIVG